MRPLPSTCAIALVGLLTHATLQAQALVTYELDVAPQLVRNDAHAIRPALRLGYMVAGRAHQPLTSFSRSFFFESTGRATLQAEGARAADNQEVGFAVGAEVSIRKVAEIDFSADPDAEEGPFVFDYGVVGLGLAGAYEASQGGDERAFRVGVAGRYTTERPWLPSAAVAFHALLPVRSEVRAALGEGEETFWRWEGGLYWFVPLGPLALALEGAGHRAYGLSAALERAGFEDGLYGSAAVVYRPLRRMGPVRLDEVFVRWTEGRRPTAPEAHRSGAVGVTLGVHR